MIERHGTASDCRWLEKDETKPSQAMRGPQPREQAGKAGGGRGEHHRRVLAAIHDYKKRKRRR